MSAGDATPGRPAVGRATPSDLGEGLRLLAEADLPGDGVEQFLHGFLVARDGEGRLVGCSGVEIHGRTGLLRSVAVAPDLRRSGLGSRLVAEALELAALEGAEEVVLLTATARDFFVERFGFEPAARDAYDRRLAASPEWRLPRCSSAVFLRLGLFVKGCADR